jgi:hypothetical protein
MRRCEEFHPLLILRPCVSHDGLSLLVFLLLEILRVLYFDFAVFLFAVRLIFDAVLWRSRGSFLGGRH